ncbi:MAG TPA: NAD(P)H-binding protein [Sphingobacteriaceae bacterium]
MKKIVVIGATGMLGKPVTCELIKAGFDVTIVARDNLKARRDFPRCRILTGDLKDVGSLETAFEGKDAVYLSLHVPQNAKPDDWHAEQEGLDNVLAAARNAGITCIGYLSSLVKNYQGMNGFNWWVFDVKRQAVEKLKTSGIPYVIFSPSNFMENFLNGFKMGKTLSTVGRSDVRKFWISGSDYGKQVAKAFEKFTESREYAIQGPAAYTDEEAVALFVRNYRKEKLKTGKVPIGMLKVMGVFSRKMKYGQQIIEALNNYPERFEAEVTWKELGKPQITIEEYARAF